MTTSAADMATSLLAAAEGLDPHHMRVVVEAYLASWRDGDAEARAALFTEDAMIEDPVGSAPLCGLAAIREFWRHAEAAGYAFAPSLEVFIPGGREALIRFEMGMSRPGEAPQVLTIHEVIRFADDYLITSLRAFFSADSFRSLSAN